MILVCPTFSFNNLFSIILRLTISASGVVLQNQFTSVPSFSFENLYFFSLTIGDSGVVLRFRLTCNFSFDNRCFRCVGVVHQNEFTSFSVFSFEISIFVSQSAGVVLQVLANTDFHDDVIRTLRDLNPCVAHSKVCVCVCVCVWDMVVLGAGYEWRGRVCLSLLLLLDVSLHNSHSDISCFCCWTCLLHNSHSDINISTKCCDRCWRAA